MLDFDNISDHELAMCVDEYVRRSINNVGKYRECDGKLIYISVAASTYQPNDEYNIVHQISVGTDYDLKDAKQSYKGNNCISGALICGQRFAADTQNIPTHVTPLLTHNVELVSENHDD